MYEVGENICTCFNSSRALNYSSMDGDSDSMSECPNGYDAQPQQNSTAPSTNGDATAKLNGGACAPTDQTTASAAAATGQHQPLHRQNGHASYTHHNNHQQHQSHNHRTVHSKATTTTTTTTTTGRGQQTKITSFYNTKSMSADATHSDRGTMTAIRDCRNGCCTTSVARSARGVSAHRAMHSLKAAHETRSCDNHDVLSSASTGGRDHHSQHQNQHVSAVSSASSVSSSACPSPSTPTTSTATAGVVVVTSNGGNGSPLRSQLGLNLKSAHTPAAAAPKSPLQVNTVYLNTVYVIGFTMIQSHSTNPFIYKV